MAKRGAEYLNSAVKTGLDAVVAAGYMSVLAVPIVVGATGSAVHPRTRSLNPFFTQIREGAKFVKIRTLPHAAEQGRLHVVEAAMHTAVEDLQNLISKDPHTGMLRNIMRASGVEAAGDEPTIVESVASQGLQTFGTKDPRTGKFHNLMRASGVDDAPQLGQILTGKWAFFGANRILLPVDQEKQRAADPYLFEDLQATIKEAELKPSLVTPSAVWRKRLHNPQSPEARRESMRRDLDFATNATFASDFWNHVRLPFDVISAALPCQKYAAGMMVEMTLAHTGELPMLPPAGELA